MNSYFEIRESTPGRYVWQLVITGRGGRRVLAESRDEFGSARKAIRLAKLAKRAASAATIEDTPGYQVSFELVPNAVALPVGGSGGTGSPGRAAGPNSLLLQLIPAGQVARDAGPAGSARGAKGPSRRTRGGSKNPKPKKK